MGNDLKWGAYWGSANVSIVEAFQERIGKELPKAYKEIVTSYNGAYIFDKDAYRFFSNFTQREEVYGFGLMHALGPADSVTETMEWSLSHKPFGFPDGLISFARDGSGNLLCFDYRNTPESDDPEIVLWHIDGQPGTGGELSRVATGFDVFMDMLFEE